MASLKPQAPARCQGCIELEKRVADMERAFALLADIRANPRPAARQKAALAWGMEAS